MNRFLPAAISLVLLPLLWQIIPLCEFRTDVDIISDGESVTFLLNGQLHSAPLALAQIHALEIHTIESAFPMGGQDLSIEQNGRVIYRERLPARFATTPGSAPALADWWVDENIVRPAQLVFRRQMADASGVGTNACPILNGPFRLRLTLTGRCLQSTKIRLIGEPGAEFPFRTGLLNNDFYIKNTDGHLTGEVQVIAPQRWRYAAFLLQPFLYSLFAACVLVILFTLLGWIISLIPRSPDHQITRSPDHPISQRLSSWGTVLSVSLLALISLLLSLWVADRILERLPHFQDDFCYLLRAKWLAAGWLSMPMPAYWAALDVPHTYFNFDTGRWLTIYPIGWPLILAVGQWFGAAWVVPPVCGALGMVLIYLLGRELYGHWTALAAMILAILSPMSVLMSASLLSHAATAMCLCLFFLLLITGWKQQSYWRMAAAGLALGYTFGIRPLTAVAVAVPAGIFLFIELIRLCFFRRVPGAMSAALGRHALTPPPQRGRLGGGDSCLLDTMSAASGKYEEHPIPTAPSPFRPLFCLSIFILGGLLGTVPTLLDNYHATGNPLIFAYTAGPKQHHWSLDNLPAAFMRTDAALATVLPMAFDWGYRFLTGWPSQSLTYAFALVVFLSGRATKYDWLLLGAFISVPLAYLGHDSSGVHGFGPRFYYDVFFALFLLTARGFAILGQLPIADARTHARTYARTFLGPRSLVILLFLALSISTTITLPERVKMYKGYNDIGRDLEVSVAQAGITRGIILLGNPSHYDWIMAANLFPADLNHADLIFAAALEDNSVLLDAHPDLPVYLWSGNLLTPYRR